MQPAFLFERCGVRELSESDLLRDARLARTDPDLPSRNLNNPAEYEEARARPAPPVTARRFGTLASARDREPLALRAATATTAAAAAARRSASWRWVTTRSAAIRRPLAMPATCWRSSPRTREAEGRSRLLSRRGGAACGRTSAPRGRRTGGRRGRREAAT